MASRQGAGVKHQATRKSVSGKFVRAQARLLQGYRHGPKRAAAIAREVERLNAAVADAARRIEFEDEPSRHAVIAEGSRRAPDRTRR